MDNSTNIELFLDKSLQTKGETMNIEAHKITSRTNGEYSTVTLPSADGFMVETCWFPNVGESEVISRDYFSINEVAARHIAEFEAL